MENLVTCPQCRTAIPVGRSVCLQCKHKLPKVPGEAGCKDKGEELRIPPEGSPIGQLNLSEDPIDLTSIFVEYKSHRRPLAIGLASFMTLVAVVFILKIVEHYFFHPERTVTSFFDALAHRDASTAGGLLLPPKGPYRVDLLQSAVLRSAGYTPPTDVLVQQVVMEKNEAKVTVGFSLNRQPQQLTLVLHRDDDATAVLFHRWRISDGGVYPLAVDLDATDLGSVQVAGKPISTNGDRLAEGLNAYPGGYQVSLPDQPLLEAVPVVAYAGIDGGENPEIVKLKSIIKGTAHNAIDQQVRSYIDECAKKTTLTLEGCPFSSSSYNTVRKVKWKIVKYPEYEIERDYTGKITLSAISLGQAVVTGRNEYSFGGTFPFSNSIDFKVSGDVAQSNGTVVFLPSAD